MINLALFVLTALGFCAGSEGVGYGLLGWLGLREKPVIVRIGVGAAIFTVLLIACGLLGLYSFLPFMLIGLLWLGIAMSRVWQWIQYWRLIEGEKEMDILPFDSFVKLGLFLFLFICLGTVLTPETRHDPYDYHLAIPHHYLVHGQIVEMPWHVFTYMPKNGEILYGFALGIGNDSFAKLIHFLFGIFVLMIVWLFVKNTIHKEAGWVACLFVVTLPLFGFLATAAYIDLIRSFWELLALLCLYYVWKQEESRQQLPWLLLSALFAGMAMGTKYTAWLIFCGPYLILFAITWWRVYKAKPPWAVPVLLVLMALPVAPWLVLNLIWTGNPMYPFFPSIFGAHTPAAMDAYAFIRGHAPEQNLFSGFALLPYAFQRIGNLLLDGNTVVILGGVALLIMPFSRKRPGKGHFPRFVVNGLFIFIFTSLTLFILGSNNMDGRFAFSTIVLFTIPLTSLLYQLKTSIQHETSERWKALILPGLLFLLFFNGLWHRTVLLDSLDETMIPKITQSQREHYLLKHFPAYPMVTWANKNLPHDVLVLGMGYPLRRDCIYGTKHGYIPFLEDLPTNPTPNQLAELLTQAGVTHMVKPYPHTRYEVEWGLLETNYLEPIHSFRSHTLYSLLETP
ncbi:phospholipid carrier-dependent glycosyltransferase [bacterium]|nr:phospholipid carrier-dependent glycosyltransferase [bacterium]